LEEAAALLLSQAKEIEGLRADAERYRWLRNADNWTEDGLVVCNGGGEDTCYGDFLDQSIDTAIAQQKETK
jgi:hypothetical protein